MNKRGWWMVGVFSFAAVTAQAEQSVLTDTRTALSKWIETRQIISKERQQWQFEKQMLTERAELLEREIDSLQQRIAEAQTSIGEADKKRGELLAENDALKQHGQQLQELATRLEGRLGELLPRLPPPLTERIKLLTQRLPSKPGETKLSVSERFQNIIGILNEITRFQREITVATETRALEEGRVAEVKTVYLGLGQAYYVTNRGDAAGVGRPGPTGWQWQRADELAGEIQQAIAILQNERVATYLPLPVEVQ
ncbi:MAG: DUF3450 domain-containing protein [Verrucomicrobiae bacterium]|nr:DUF3450 domain-containing protein [Verrucomicrobiae bacterium]